MTHRQRIRTALLMGSFIVLSGFGNLLPPCLSQDEKELFLVAQKAFEDGFYDVAIRYINQYLEKFPQTEKRMEANLLLGQCYFFKNQYLKAFDIFQDLLQYPEFKDATLFWLGETYFKGSDYAQAEKQYRQLIEIFPNSIYTPQAYYSLGWVFFEQKNFKTAKETFLELVAKFPLHQLTEDAYFKVGECEYNQKLYDNTVEYFQNYVLKFPKSSRHDQAYFFIAESYYYQENFPSAISYYSKTIEISQDKNMILMSKVSLGWAQLKLKQFPEAQKSFEEALVFAQEKVLSAEDIYLGQASLYSEMEESEKALGAFEELIHKYPESSRIAEAYLGKANMLYLLKRYPEAVSGYEELIQNFSDKPEFSEITEKAYFGLAWTQLKKGDIEQSIAHFDEILNRSDNKIVKVSALTQMGDAYQDIGQLEKALETYDRIMRDFPDTLYSDYVQYRQGVALLKMDQIEAATISLQALQTNFPKSKYFKDSEYFLGVAYFKKGDWPSAREHIENFLKDLTKEHNLTGEAHYILALSSFNMSEYDKAEKLFERIVKNYPDQDALVKNAEIGIAKCLNGLGDPKEAIKRFKIIIYKYPGTEAEQDSLLWLGDYYLENSDFPSAIEYYQQFLDKFPNSEKINVARFELGQSFQAQGSLDKALNMFQLVDDPQDKELYAKAKLAIAEIFSRELDLDSAIATYQNIAVSCPDFQRDAFLKIAEAYHSKKIYDKAVEAYQNAIHSEKGLSELSNAELQFNIGDTYELSNKPVEAVDSYLKIPYLYPKEKGWVTKAYLRIARIFEDQENWNEAKLTYEKIIALGTDEVKFAQERLNWIDENVASYKN